MERVKWTENIKNAIMLERVGQSRIMLELIKKRKRNRRSCLLKALERMVKGKEVCGRRRYQMIENIVINGLYAESKWKVR